MIKATKAKEIRVMLTTFRDGLQSSFGGKVRLNDYLAAMKASVDIGIRHFEFGGGARFQAPYFYLAENPFEVMKAMRDAVGSGIDLQILTRSVSGVTLTNQSIDALQLQAKLMQRYGTTIDRNFDFMNDVDNLIKTGKPIVDAGMHHQVCIALMGLPFESDQVHTAEFYINIGKQLLKSDVRIDSVCLKDASGTTDPNTIYHTMVGLRKIMPADMPLWMHTHDTASTAVSCYLAAIEGGADGVDLSVRPMASGTVQPDARSLAHALKGSGYTLDFDVTKLATVEAMLEDLLRDYDFNPATTTADARVLGFPMPGGAIGPNVHMMVKAGIIDRYSEVLAEFPVVVKAGGAWTSVTPGSQQYWLQAFNNVLMGRWKKMDPGYGKSVLGYFGRTPLPPDPEVVKIASEQLNLPVFTGDPLAAAPKTIETARQALVERGLPTTEENIFLVLAAIVPGKKMELNEGIRLLTGQAKVDIPLKAKATEATPAMTAASPVTTSGPVVSRCTVEENGVTRTFTVTLQPASSAGQTATASTQPATASSSPAVAGAVSAGPATPVFSPFAGSVEVVDIRVKSGDTVTRGKVVAAVEAMKAQHDIKAPCDGRVGEVYARVGQEIDQSKPILTIV